MTTATDTPATFDAWATAHRVTLNAKYVRGPLIEGRAPKDADWKDTAHEWNMTVRGAGGVTSFRYYMGSGLPRKAPTAREVFSGQAMDARAVGQSFVDWCSEYDANTDSIKDRNLYDACTEQARALRQAVGHPAFRALLDVPEEV